MLENKIKSKKETIKLVNKYGESFGNAYIHIKINNFKKCLIVESDNKTNPAEYVMDIFEFVKPFIINNKNVHVYLDLSNYYGINNSSWLYEWIFKINNNQLIETDFIRIDKWSKLSDKMDYAILQDYLFEKFHH
ncbi:hypothetical protein ThesiDRAFT1_0913 [Thermoanaerobacter siderophilus SR4]|uniref:Uncharacterized protein n=2 Tax=Thermoanaerobacter TaxID=1754 RepID=I9KSJ4_9THEO|nr:hypothetical protein ThesiDRAFT1_0913 [Thermoanaerobacter siderophilus SR4]